MSGQRTRQGRQALQASRGGPALGSGDSPGGTKPFGGSSGNPATGGTDTGGLGGTLSGEDLIWCRASCHEHTHHITTAAEHS